MPKKSSAEVFTKADIGMTITSLAGMFENTPLPAERIKALKELKENNNDIQ